MNPAPPHCPRSRRHGSVLIVVLVVCLGLVSLALVLGHAMLMAYRGSDNELAGRQADAATLGAVHYVGTLMTNVTTPGDVPDPATYQSEAVPMGEASFWFLGVPAAGDTNDQPIFRLVDEAAKLNLNKASFAMIRLLPGMTDELAQAIVDWRTAPGTAATPATTGASTGTTITTGAIKQGPFESVEELGLVLGGTDPTLLYGDDANLNHVLDPEESSTAGTSGQGQYTAGFLEYCTVHSREPNVLSDGTQKTNVAVEAGVTRLLDSTLGQRRGARVAGTVQAALAREGITQIIRLPDGRETNTAWVTSVLEFYALSGLSAEDFAKVSPSLTVGSGNYATGLINVNTAGATVLSCVPGITEDLAAQLVAARPQQASASGATVATTANTSDWAWVVAILGPRLCRTAGPWLTTRSYQLSADVAAVGRYGRGYRRTRFVVDLSTGKPQVVYRRDLSFLGWALGRDARANLLNQQSLTQGGTRQ